MMNETNQIQADCTPGLDSTVIATLDLIDHRSVNWGQVERTAYLLHQHLRYEYPGPIHNLNQRLVIVPHENYGDQRLITHRLEISNRAAQMTRTLDEFGNPVIQVFVPRVEKSIDFEAWIVVERTTARGSLHLAAHALTDPRYLEPSALVDFNDDLRRVAAELAERASEPLALAQHINAWVYRNMSYGNGTTNVCTPASEAFALQKGVCQDYAQIMLALCRLNNIPARYVSGHLLGEGGTHAWVEVLVPDPAAPDQAIAAPFDPTNDRRCGLSYITVAVGRDYSDVAPTSGTFTAPYGGQLSTRKQAGVTELQYFPS